MESLDTRKLRPLLRLFRLTSAHFKNELDGKKVFRFRVKKEVSVGIDVPTEEPKVKKGRKSSKSDTTKSHEDLPKDIDVVKGFVEITLTAHFQDSDDNPLENVVATASYYGHFDFNKEAQTSDIQKAIEDEAYQYLFVAQAFPLATRHFKDQLFQMGLTNNALPLGIT